MLAVMVSVWCYLYRQVLIWQECRTLFTNNNVGFEAWKNAGLGEYILYNVAVSVDWCARRVALLMDD